MNSFKPNSNYNIEIFDNVLPFSEIDEINNFLTDGFYRYQIYDNEEDNHFQPPKLSNVFVLNGKVTQPRWDSLAKQFNYYLTLINYQIPKDYIQSVTMQVNVSNPFTFDNFHKDVGGNLKGYTILYYANKKWDVNYGGETLFYDDNNLEIIAAVKPKPGRFVVFDSTIYHSARPPQSRCPYNRYTIAIKYVVNPN
jgi:Rps23 Pro-64 3,4-dihydroxylase Tpa1-like proline 4-hydroxylase